MGWWDGKMAPARSNTSATSAWPTYAALMRAVLPVTLSRTCRAKGGGQKKGGRGLQETLAKRFKKSLSELSKTIEATNPQLFKDRAEARMRTGEWPGAADDAERAQLEFKQLGDKIRALLSAADGARVRARARVKVRARVRVRVS